MNAIATFIDFSPFIILFLLAHIAFIYLLCKSCYRKGYDAGRMDEHAWTAKKILNAKKEGMLAERQRLSPSTTSKQ